MCARGVCARRVRELVLQKNVCARRVRAFECHLDLSVHMLRRDELIGHKREELIPLNVAVAPLVNLLDGALDLLLARIMSFD